MSMISKVIGIAMLIIGILALLEQYAIFNLYIGFDKLLIGAALMIAQQILSLILLKGHNQPIRFINIIIAVVFIIPAAIYLAAGFLPFSLPPIGMLIAIMITIEGLYALH